MCNALLLKSAYQVYLMLRDPLQTLAPQVLALQPLPPLQTSLRLHVPQVMWEQSSAES